MRQEFEIKEEGELGGRVLIRTHGVCYMIKKRCARVGFLLHDEEKERQSNENEDKKRGLLGWARGKVEEKLKRKQLP